MTLFLGEYSLTFSGKGRLVLPRKFREEIGRERTIILSRGLDGCIFGFSKKDWQREAKKQLEIPITEEEGRTLRRYLFSAAESVHLDDQGRFVIPGALLKYAELSVNAVLVGAGDHFEIWNPKRWEVQIKKFSKKKI